ADWLPPSAGGFPVRTFKDYLSKDDWLEQTLDSTTLSPTAASEGKPGHMRELIKATSIFQSGLLCLSLCCILHEPGRNMKPSWCADVSAIS
ncbi:hypothetical protein AMECASPLE_019427, partial [Ameca splendens]